jgi:hypothetical protein
MILLILTIIFLGLIVFLSLVTIGYFNLIIPLLFGLIPLLFLKKLPKKQILKNNIIISIIFLILTLILYLIFNYIIKGYSSEVSGIIAVINVFNNLIYALSGILLYNVPFLLYYLFNKE